MRRYLSCELAIDLGDRLGNTDLLVEASPRSSPDIEEQGRAELIDLGGVDEDPVVVVEFVPVVGRVDVRVGGVRWIGSRLAGHAAIFVPI